MSKARSLTWRPLAARNKAAPSGLPRAKAPAAYRLLAVACVCGRSAICTRHQAQAALRLHCLVICPLRAWHGVKLVKVGLPSSAPKGGGGEGGQMGSKQCPAAMPSGKGGGWTHQLLHRMNYPLVGGSGFHLGCYHTPDSKKHGCRSHRRMEGEESIGAAWCGRREGGRDVPEALQLTTEAEGRVYGERGEGVMAATRTFPNVDH